MIEITNFADAREALNRFISVTETAKPAKYSLKNMFELMKALGNPQNSYKAVHIAGTSGKTSTSYYVASLLQVAGKKVGLTVSPHVDEINERVQINLLPMPERIFCHRLEQFLRLIEAVSFNPSYFEVMAAFAFWVFAIEKVDYAVVEVGLGGLLDGTNVMTRQDKVCIITDIGLDHTKVLGKTLSTIAAQKAGIIKPHNPVFMYKQRHSVMSMVRKVCADKNAILHEICPNDIAVPNVNLPLFQQRNWYLAKTIFDYLTQRDGLELLTVEQLRSSAKTNVPARMQIFNIKDKALIIDGSHNGQKIKVLLESIKSRFPQEKIAVLTSFAESKNNRAKEGIKELASVASYIVLTSFNGPEDVPKHSVEPGKLADYCNNIGFSSYGIIKKPEEAFKALLERPEPVLLVTGSFYLLNHIRPLVLNKKVGK